MVLLTMTASIVEALKNLDESIVAPAADTSRNENWTDDEPSLQNAAVGNPISHGQIIDIWKQLGAKGDRKHSLEYLLRGAAVYIPPAPPKPEPSDEYKALMARLRREEEERSYERMLKAPPTRETFSQRYPTAAGMTQADSYLEANKPFRQSDMGEENIAHGEVQQQVSLIVNFLVSIVGCAGAIWIVAQWWSTTARLFLTLGGSIVVGIAEIAVYSAYSWRMAEGDRKQQSLREVREVVKTWVVGDDDDTKKGRESVLIQPKDHDTDTSLRKRLVVPP